MMLLQLREKLEEYLDGGLDPAGRREVEATLALDSAAARMFADLQSQRALRAAAFDTYLPTNHESRAFAERVLAAACETPAGRIGYWVRRGAAVAAAVAILVGAFAVGRLTASSDSNPVIESRIEYDVVWVDADGVQQVRDFASLDERNKFIQQLEQQGATGIAVAEVMAPGRL
jgi:anti-sigma factor RsiW